jgi:deoxyribose-phosphate aldolase
MSASYPTIAKTIDHSLLNPALNERELQAGCELAAAYGVATICVLPYYVAQAARLLAGSGVLTTSTVGFPHGAQHSALKLEESRLLLADGARELDMVVNVSRVKSGDFAQVEDEVGGILGLTRGADAKLKVIFENCYLTDDEKIRLCEICGRLAVDWVKTSTGFGSGGSTWHDLELMRRHSPPGVQVKAAGGLRDLDSLLKARSLGATRVGSSATAQILDDCRSRLASGQELV